MRIVLRRLLLSLLVATVLGAVTVCGVAFACAYWSRASSSGLQKSGLSIDGGIAMQAARSFGVERALLDRGHLLRGGLRAPPSVSHKAPVWIIVPDMSRQPHLWTSEWIGAGWPRICFRAHTDFDLANFDPIEKQWAGGILLKPGPALTRFSDRVIPYGPVWSGLMLNLLIFTGVWFVLMGSVTFSRIMLRRACGRCLACGHNLHATTGDACPECGMRLRGDSQQRGEDGIRNE